jgi:hypothetical protein
MKNTNGNKKTSSVNKVKKKGCREIPAAFQIPCNWFFLILKAVLSDKWISHQKNKRYNQAVNGQ